MKTNDKKKILIVDDSEMNRMILTDILEESFEILEADCGEQAIKLLKEEAVSISLVLLDIVMPGMDGFEVLKVMNQNHWIETIPVVMISAENSPAYIEKAYELGVTDFISRPFDSSIVYRRANNTIRLYEKQRRLEDMVTDQVYENEKRSNLMVAILSHIVEFRNGESGLHVLHVQSLTEILLKKLIKRTRQYPLTSSQISLISMISALHDIGKIGIPDHILNKPGRLTDEEFNIMKTHTTLGASMLKDIPFYEDEELMKIAIEICYYHHERYDGKGYPLGLKGEDIPITAQVVSLADVYDALTSERIYKKAYSHEKAMDMILHGECGVFNPILLECLKDSENDIHEMMNGNTLSYMTDQDVGNLSEVIDYHDGFSASERALELLEYEKKKNEFFAMMSQEIQFECSVESNVLILSDHGAKVLGLPEVIVEPLKNEKFLACFDDIMLQQFYEHFDKTTPEQPVIQFEFEMMLNHEKRWHRMIAQTIWSHDKVPVCTKFFGKITDIHREYMELSDLRVKSSQDGLTRLYNRETAQQLIKEKVLKHPHHLFAFIIMDVDDFKLANDQYGHIFGDEVLCCVADRLLQSIRSDDIAARIGGDEFLLFLEYKSSLEMIVDRIFHVLNTTYKDFDISVSMGVSKSEDVGTDFQTMYQYADEALYQSKNQGKKSYCFYQLKEGGQNDDS